MAEESAVVMNPKEEEEVRRIVAGLLDKMTTRDIANVLAHRLENNPTGAEIKAAAVMLRDMAEVDERAFKVIDQYRKHFDAARKRRS